MQTVSQAALTLPPKGATSFESLRRPLLRDDRQSVWNEQDARAHVVRFLKILADELGQCGAEQVAQQLIWTMMLESMNARMLDAETGPLPKFISQLERSARLFDRHLR